VVRGAVICGVEKATTSNLSQATATPAHYGVCVSERYSKIHHDEKDIGTHPALGLQVAQGQMLWMINRGDLILSDDPHTVSQVIMTSFKEADSKDRKLTVYSYPDDDDRPTTITNSLDGKHLPGHNFARSQVANSSIVELKVVHALEYDLSEIPLKSLEKSKGKDGTYYSIRLKLSLTATSAGLDCTLSWGTTELASATEPW